MLSPGSNTAFVVFVVMVVCWGLGLLAGYMLGKNKTMTKSEAARVMAKASWLRRG